ncbi:LOW QUALITY PROTEIN: putative F-box protein At1g65770 [Medicago truncatula]|uniref:LOW QUALITY PROTEIN: putative F-box protein At1g65770 n=1 Tax=Medicago truncatula TaxID=3880 RepID=UPI0019670EF1|nr:LOW QUALITY PROTEIN: putative F-box protein At1g65770 [Medicago truncatula]
MGTIFWINNALSLKLVQFSPKNFFCGEKSNIWKNHVAYNKQLVEFDGNLCVVDMYIDDERFYKLGHFLKAIRVKVYKLDQEWGKWLYVKDLGDVSFVLGKDSNFALLARDYYGCEGNCTYFYCEDRTYCFNLENLEAKPANIFWPCPTLFHSITS